MRKTIWAIVAGMLCVAATAPPRETFAIDGIHIGNSPLLVAYVLQHSGYTITRQVDGPSYKQRLADAYADQIRHPRVETMGTAVSEIIASNGEQRINVRFDDDARRLRVATSIQYESPSIGRPYEEVRAKLVDRYGTPTITRPIGSMWCDSDSPHDCPSLDHRSDRLTVGQGSGGITDLRNLVDIELSVGKDALDAWKAAHQADLSAMMKTRDAF